MKVSYIVAIIFISLIALLIVFLLLKDKTDYTNQNNYYEDDRWGRINRYNPIYWLLDAIYWTVLSARNDNK